jgi:hypothetical protein
VNRLPPATTKTKRERQAEVAAVLAAAYRNEDIEAEDALRIIRHELRRLQTNKKLGIPQRSKQAEKVIREYSASDNPLPKNGSGDALHADHIHPVTTKQLKSLITKQQWLRALNRLGRVVCVTATENYQLQHRERAGTTGPKKYDVARITFVDQKGRPWKP